MGLARARMKHYADIITLLIAAWGAILSTILYAQKQIDRRNDNTIDFDIKISPIDGLLIDREISTNFPKTYFQERYFPCHAIITNFSQSAFEIFDPEFILFRTESDGTTAVYRKFRAVLQHEIGINKPSFDKVRIDPASSVRMIPCFEIIEEYSLLMKDMEFRLYYVPRVQSSIYGQISGDPFPKDDISKDIFIHTRMKKFFRDQFRGHNTN